VTLCFCFIGCVIFGFYAWQCRDRTCPGCRLGQAPALAGGLRKEKAGARWRDPAGKRVGLSAQLELLEDRGVAVEVRALEVVEELAPARGHSNETPARVEVLAIIAKVLREVFHPSCKQGNLHLT